MLEPTNERMLTEFIMYSILFFFIIVAGFTFFYNTELESKFIFLLIFFMV